ncbi:pilin [Patescibacteria group bacterium]|nr:pilin [Patescibacteria group bacterium]
MKLLILKSSALKACLICYLVFVIVFLLSMVPAVFGQQQAGEKCSPAKDSILLSMPIPGTDSSLLQYNQACQMYEFKGDLTDYIKALYKFFVGIAGILAVFMIMFGGIQWLFSGGNAQKVSSAKETIFGAVIGLILAIGSYTILQVINPRLVKFSRLADMVVQVQIGSKDWYDENGRCKPANQLPCGAYCEPLENVGGEPVLGVCSFCTPSILEDNYVSCGKSKLGSESTEGEGNCWYAQCPVDAACTYVGSFSSVISPGSVFQPQCSGTINISSGEKSYTYTFNRRSGILDTYYSLECGNLQNQIIVRPYAWWNPTPVRLIGHRWVGTACPYNRNCVIDISKGYTITGDIDYIPLVSHFNYIGDFNDAKCIP